MKNEWTVTSNLRAANHASDDGYIITHTLQQMWRNKETGAEEWRDIPVVESKGGVVWSDMAAETGGYAKRARKKAKS